MHIIMPYQMLNHAACIQSKEKVLWTFYENLNLINGFSMGVVKSCNCILKVLCIYGFDFI